MRTRTVSISQPMYFAWPGLIAHMAMSDVWVWLDDAQYSKGSFTNRVQLRSPRPPSWMTIPLRASGSFQRILDLEAKGEDWVERHLRSLESVYGVSAYWREAQGLAEVIAHESGPLCDKIIRSTEDVARSVGALPMEVVRSSALNIGGRGSARVLDIVQRLRGERYLSGQGGRKYLLHEQFERAQVDVQYMVYDFIPWGQGGGVFTPYVTTLDLISEVGTSRARNFLTCRSVPWHTSINADGS